MKHCLMLLTLCALFCACSSSQKADEGYYSYTENGVLEEEFDLLVAPKMDYEKDIPYEDQIKEVTAKEAATKNTNKKPAKKPTAKQVTK